MLKTGSLKLPVGSFTRKDTTGQACAKQPGKRALITRCCTIIPKCPLAHSLPEVAGDRPPRGETLPETPGDLPLWVVTLPQVTTELIGIDSGSEKFREGQWTFRDYKQYALLLSVPSIAVDAAAGRDYFTTAIFVTTLSFAPGVEESTR
jgi:hypothetical protein